MGDQEELSKDTKFFLKLKEGEVRCDECLGLGVKCYVEVDSDELGDIIHIQDWSKCKKCLGDGKLDWVENMIGKKGPKDYGSIFKYDRKTGKVVRAD